MPSKNVATTERFVAAVFAGDHAVLRELLHPDFELHQAAGLEYAGLYRGADGFLAFLQKFAATYEIELLERTHSYVSDDNPDLLVFEFAFRGTLKSSGRKFDTTMLERWTFQDGKVIRVVPHYFEIPR